MFFIKTFLRFFYYCNQCFTYVLYSTIYNIDGANGDDDDNNNNSYYYYKHFTRIEYYTLFV